MREVIFWGGTGQAKVLYEAIDSTTVRLEVIVDNRKLDTSPILEVPLLYGEEGLDVWLKERNSSSPLYYVVAVGGGNGKDRLEIMDSLQKRGLSALSIVHRTAFIAKGSSVGEGAQILAMAAVCANSRLGRGVIINTSASVDHDCVIGDGVHIGPGARLTGEVIVEDGVFMGAGAIVLPRIRIGRDAIVGAGAVVTKDVASGVTVIGNPADIAYLKHKNIN